MENNYSNYDMLDKLIANNKKAKSWTAFWMLILCLMSGAVLWLAYTVNTKNKTIKDNQLVIASNIEILELKSRIIDSLTENCNVAKTDIIKGYDSVIMQTQQALAIVTEEVQPGNNIQISEVQQQKITEAKSSIKRLKTELNTTKLEIKKENPRLFIQYNSTEKAKQVERFLYLLKNESDYVIAPAEYINNNFSTVIKFYNYRNPKEEELLKNLITKLFNTATENIKVTYEENAKIKPTVEIWLGTTTKRLVRPDQKKLQLKN